MVDYELNELKREFLDEAREKVDEMAQAIGSMREPDARERMAYLAHQLKGSGGSYGYQRISADAAEVEKAVESMGSESNGTQLEKIELHVGALKSEIERAAEELR